MKYNLYLKTIFLFLLVGVLGFFGVATFGSYYMEQQVTKAYAGDLYREANTIADQYVKQYDSKSLPLSEFKSHLDPVAKYLDGDIWIIERSGKILAHNASAKNVPESVDAFNPTDMGTAYWQIGKFYKTFSEDRLTVQAPISSEMKTIGYVLIHEPVKVVKDRKDRYLNVVYVSYLILYICFVLLATIFLHFSVYKPLRTISKGVKEYGAGNYKHRIPVDANDEIGRLSADLNYMAAGMSSADEYQKKFIANVSHDFRSPLTSIKGYIEAMLDGTIPVEFQEKYLNIVLFETNRLTKLTQGLLTLNNLDGKGAYLEKSDFDIQETIKSTVATFEGTCTQKRISIDLILLSGTVNVRADMGKIQQVLYNLIDNAIKFSSNNSTITVETSERGEKVFVSVKDTGIGIPKEDLPKIWERFYKTDLSRGKDKKGTGLGLSITKEIIQAHGENINVVSTPGVGTEFIFSLPKSRK